MLRSPLYWAGLLAGALFGALLKDAAAEEVKAEPAMIDNVQPTAEQGMVVARNYYTFSNPTPIQAGETRFIYGQDCFVHQAGYAEYVAKAADGRILIRYLRNDEFPELRSDECPVNTLFFVSADLWQRMVKRLNDLAVVQELLPTQ